MLRRRRLVQCRNYWPVHICERQGGQLFCQGAAGMLVPKPRHTYTARILACSLTLSIAKYGFRAIPCLEGRPARAEGCVWISVGKYLRRGPAGSGVCQVSPTTAISASPRMVLSADLCFKSNSTIHPTHLELWDAPQQCQEAASPAVCRTLL